jgi:hypothetical protein
VYIGAIAFALKCFVLEIDLIRVMVLNKARNVGDWAIYVKNRGWAKASLCKQQLSVETFSTQIVWRKS